VFVLRILYIILDFGFWTLSPDGRLLLRGGFMLTNIDSSINLSQNKYSGIINTSVTPQSYVTHRHNPQQPILHPQIYRPRWIRTYIPRRRSPIPSLSSLRCQTSRSNSQRKSPRSRSNQSIIRSRSRHPRQHQPLQQ
jgi:hypothetical protein